MDSSIFSRFYRAGWLKRLPDGVTSTFRLFSWPPGSLLSWWVEIFNHGLFGFGYLGLTVIFPSVTLNFTSSVSSSLDSTLST